MKIVGICFDRIELVKLEIYSNIKWKRKENIYIYS